MATQDYIRAVELILASIRLGRRTSASITKLWMLRNALYTTDVDFIDPSLLLELERAKKEILRPRELASIKRAIA